MSFSQERILILHSQRYPFPEVAKNWKEAIESTFKMGVATLPQESVKLQLLLDCIDIYRYQENNHALPSAKRIIDLLSKEFRPFQKVRTSVLSIGTLAARRKKCRCLESRIPRVGVGMGNK